MFTTDTIGLSDLTNTKQHTLAVSGNLLTLDGNTISGIASSGISTNPLQISKAWVNWSGTSTGAVIMSSYNISGITRNGAGDYTYWFSGVMNDNKYCAVFGGRSTPASNYGQYEQHDTPYRTISGLRVYTTENWNTSDLPVNSALFFGN